MLREIRIYSTNGVSGTISTNVTTLGALKPLLMERGINFDGMKMLVGATKNELSEDVALLPDTDFKLYLMPVKTKSGNHHRIAELYETIAECHSEIADLTRSSARASQPVAKTYPQPVMSREDQEAMADLRAMQNGTMSSSNSWD